MEVLLPDTGITREAHETRAVEDHHALDALLAAEAFDHLLQQTVVLLDHPVFERLMDETGGQDGTLAVVLEKTPAGVPIHREECGGLTGQHQQRDACQEAKTEPVDPKNPHRL